MNLRGIMIRSQVQWLTDCENPSKYFCSLKKTNYIEKTVKKIVKEDDKIVTDHQLKCFYEN